MILYAMIFFFQTFCEEEKVWKTFPSSPFREPLPYSCAEYPSPVPPLRVCMCECVCARGDRGVSYGRLAFAAGAESVVEASPGLKGFARPNPEASRDPNNHSHEVLDHEDSEVWAHRGKVAGTGHSICFAGLEEPRLLPGATEGLLVEVTGQDNGGRHRVEDTEDTNAHHQLLQFLRLGAIVLHDGADAKQGHKASQQEGSANKEIHKQGRQHKAPQ